jgi:predicted metal-dependent phosphoesterase TrpH
MSIQTLHSHTIQSDGKHTHLEVLDICKKYNIGTIAFTDHDSLMSDAQFKELKALNSEIKWISGIEISSGLPQELGGGPGGDFHIVGLFVDPTNKELQEHCKLALDARVARMQGIVKNLKSLGFNISEEDCLKASGGESVGRPHIVQALNSHEENRKVIQALRARMEKDSKDNPELKVQYDAMIERGEDQFPYELFLSSSAYLPGIYVDYLYAADMDKSVSLIRNAGGIAIVAHYFTIIKKIPEEMMGKFFSENRIDGIETVFGLFGYGTNFEAEIKRTREISENLAKMHNRLRSGGADAHKEDDFKQFAEAEWYSKQTEGFAEKMIASGKVNTAFSNM